MINKFNNKDLLRDIRTGVLNPMVDSTNANTLGVNILKQDVSSISRRVGTLEPIVKTNSINLTALNQLAQHVAQQVTLAYDKATVDDINKHLTFTSIGGVEKTIDLSQMFIDPIGMEIEVSSDKDPDDTFSVHKLNFKDNIDLQIRREDASLGNYYIADISVPKIRGHIEGHAENDIRKIVIAGNIGASQLQGGTLRIDLPTGGTSNVGGFFLDPNPPRSNVNLFIDNTQALAEKLRDAYFSNHVDDLKTYDDNVLKCILVEWNDGSDIRLEFQSRHSGIWINPFNFTFTSIDLSKHKISDLSDGHRVDLLEAETINEAENVGGGSDIFKEKIDRRLVFRKLKSESDDLEISTSRDDGITFRTNPHWRGYYDSPGDASNDISVSDRIKDKTTIIANNSLREPNMYVWDGTTWSDKDLAGHVEIAADGVNWKALKKLKAGKNVKFSNTVESGETVYSVDVESTLCAKLKGGQDQQITGIEVENKFASVDGTVLKLPSMSAFSTNDGDLGQFKNIKQGSNINLSVDASTGVLTIASTGGSSTSNTILVKTGTETDAVPITQITDPSKYSTVNSSVYTPGMLEWKSSTGSSNGFIKNIDNGSNVGFELDDETGSLTVSSWMNITLPDEQKLKGFKSIKSDNPYHSFDNSTKELTLHSINATNGSDLGIVKTIKAGSNVTFDMSAEDATKGVLTINSTGGGGSGPGSINVTIGIDTNTKIATTIHSESIYSTFENGKLNIHAIDCNNGTDRLGLVKTLKAGANVTFIRGTSEDEDGVLTISSVGGGSGASIQAKTGTNSSDYHDITKIESLESNDVIENGVLKLKPVIYKKNNNEIVSVEGVKVIKAGTGIGFSEGEDDNHTIEINNEGMLKGKIKTESSEGALKQVEQINFVSDAVNCKIEGTGPTIMTLDTRGFPAGASTLEELKSKFPVTDNAYRHGYTGNDKAVYFAHVTGSESGSPSSEWKLHNYYGMADEVKSSSSRFPEQTTETSSAYDPSDIKNGYRYFSQEHSSGFFPEAADREFGILENITASQKRRSQMFYGMESGGVWFRHMDHLTTAGADTDFKGWQQIAGVSEEYHSILTIPSFKITTANNEIDGVKALPWMVMQDPKCNVSVDGADTTKFVVNKNGTYDITVCFHITSAGADTDTKPVNYTFQLKKTVDGTVVQTVEKNNVVIPTSGIAKGLYPPVRVTFTNVKVVTRTSDSFKVTAKVDRASTLISKVPYLDSFKNYLVVQPSSSNTKQGIVIAEGFRRAFGGFSSKPGYEVHVEGTSAGAANVRVYGALVNDKLQN